MILSPKIDSFELDWMIFELNPSNLRGRKNIKEVIVLGAELHIPHSNIKLSKIVLIC